MDARIEVDQVGGILVTREYWSRKVVAVGATPPGYLALAGPGSRKSIKWCGHEIDSRRVLCGLDSSEVHFATPEEEVHWVLLIPQELLANYLGDQTVESLRGRRVLRCPSDLSRRLFALANRAVDPSSDYNGSGVDVSGTKALRADLLEAASQLVTGDDGDRKYSNPRRRYQACCRAIAYANSLRVPISVPELASEVQVSRRTLERAFEETLGVSPYKFLRLHRFNRLHRDLLSARAREKPVTALLLDWGFTELGRTAVEYRSLFGESPSATLAEGLSSPGLRLADALVDGPRG